MIDLQGNPVRWKTTTHASRQIAHAVRRANERYGFDFTPDDYTKLRERLIRQFEDQTGIVFLAKHGFSSQFAVWHGCEWIPLAYDKRFKTIVTFLPKHALRRHKAKLPW